MNFPSFEIPEEDEQLAAWLEQQLVGMDLGDLVVQLVLVCEESTGVLLDEALAGQLPRVLESGLHSLSTDELRGLLGQPLLLLELQDRIFVEGGTYWQRVPRNEAHQAATRRVQEEVSRRIAHLGSVTPAAGRFRVLRMAVPLAIAASLLVAAGIWLLRPEPQPTWGFGKPGALAMEDLSASESLKRLADSAGQWFNQRPNSRDALSARIKEFRAGCEALLTAEVPQLAPDDHRWLNERCRAWIEKLDGHLSDLAEGRKPVDQVRGETDETVNKLIATLRERAEST